MQKGDNLLAFSVWSVHHCIWGFTFIPDRDIKLENTLLDGSKRLVKITDFGYAKSNIDSMPISNVGTPNYAGKLCFETFTFKEVLCLCHSPVGNGIYLQLEAPVWFKKYICQEIQKSDSTGKQLLVLLINMCSCKAFPHKRRSCFGQTICSLS